MRSKRYGLALPLAPLRVGQAFRLEDWPLHVTVLPNFASTLAASALFPVIEGVASGWLPATALAARFELFGPNVDIPVTVLHDAEEVEALHRSLADALDDLVELESPEFSRDGYRPHVTHCRAGITKPGSVLRLTEIALVDIDSDGKGLRRVVRVADFG